MFTPELKISENLWRLPISVYRWRYIVLPVMAPSFKLFSDEADESLVCPSAVKLFAVLPPKATIVTLVVCSHVAAAGYCPGIEPKRGGCCS